MAVIRQSTDCDVITVGENNLDIKRCANEVIIHIQFKQANIFNIIYVYISYIRLYILRIYLEYEIQFLITTT